MVKSLACVLERPKMRKPSYPGRPFDCVVVLVTYVHMDTYVVKRRGQAASQTLGDERFWF